jgi:hypothetical protein
MSAAPTQSEPPSPLLRLLRLDEEAFGKAVEVADGFWVLATRHAPRRARHEFEINDRCLLFRLEEGSERILVAVNAVDPSALAEVKRVARETGLPVRYVISPGGAQHSELGAWREELPDATILVCPVRTPRTPVGRKLLGLARVETMPIDDPLPRFGGQLDAVLFHGLTGLVDLPRVGFDACGSALGPFKAIVHMMFNVKDPIDELWLHHVPTGTVIGGENLGWQIVKPDRLSIQRVARRVADGAVVAECWRRVLTWPARAVMTYHDPPTTAFFGDGQAALRDAARAAGQLHEHDAERLNEGE